MLNKSLERESLEKKEAHKQDYWNQGIEPLTWFKWMTIHATSLSLDTIFIFASLIFKIDSQNFEKLEKGFPNPFFWNINYFIKNCWINCVCNHFYSCKSHFWHKVYLISICSLIKSIALLVGFESLFFACIH
jgi:hypothetical protein